MKALSIKGHSYQIAPHSTGDLGPLALKLAALASGPLLAVLKSQAEGQSFGDIDLSQISADEVQRSLLTVASNLTQEDLRLLFSMTQRDGKHLSDPLQYDLAYKGAWQEFFLALKAILEVNGFLSFLDSSAATAA